MFGIDDIVGNILGIGKTVVDRLVPDVNKKQDQDHESAMAQINATTEGEKNRNYFTPRAILLYVVMSPLVYAIISGFSSLIGLPLPPLDPGVVKVATQVLFGLIGL